MTSTDHQQRPTRRDFLQGRAAAQVLADTARVATGPWPDADEPAPGPFDLASSSHQRGLVVSIRRRAMACEFEVQLAAGRSDDALDWALQALDLVEALEDQLTVYRDDSEVIRINRRAVDGPMAVEPRLLALLQLAQRLHHETAGALDITSGPLSEVWGFSRRAGRLPGDDEIAAALARVGMKQVRLNPSDRTISFLRPGVAINLNCIGKGYALDRMAELLDAKSVGDYLLHGGRSSVWARGNCPGSERLGWSIGIRHPLRPGERLAELRLVNEALGTSGSATQFFSDNGRSYGHVLDPRTGWPASGIHSATVIAPTAAEADALSTAFYVMGPDEIAEYCTSHPGVAAVLVCPAAAAGEVELRSFGLADEQWRQRTDR